MYRAFELLVDKNILKDNKYSSAIDLGYNSNRANADDIELLLTKHIIDGEMLTEQYFPTIRKDVFLSYSHNDISIAYTIAGILEEWFGLSTFIDSLFWGKADKLLKIIDDQYCLKDDGRSYDYEKRNFSTAHVHAMLTSAIMRVMDQSEIIIFLNTPQSIPNIVKAIANEGYDDYTLSPWIYEEILFTTILRETDWEIYRQERNLNESSLGQFERNLRIKYKIPKKKLIPLTLDDIDEWYIKFKKRRDAETGRYGGITLKPNEHEKHPLNVLYEIKCGIDGSKEA